MKIAILGYGVEGKAAASYFQQKGHSVTICDARKNANVPKNMQKRCGSTYLKKLTEFDLIIRSPGITPFKKELLTVKDRVSSVTRYFFEHCPCPIIGVTGTKGKGTTSSLITAMLQHPSTQKRISRNIFFGGNIGTPPLSFLDELTARDLVVLELSSFQLIDLPVSPHIAVVLGIVPDHLDYHRDLEEYVEAKRNIVRFQKKNDVAVIDIDTQFSADFADSTAAKIFEISTAKIVQRGGFLKVGSFMITEDDTALLVGEKGNTRLIGDHNVKNILAASVAAYVVDAPVEAVSEVIRTFPPLAHRLEFIAERDGIRYFNDSASTNPFTTIAALRSFSDPVVLILGGSSKNADFRPLAEEIIRRKNVNHIVIMGETRSQLEETIEKTAAEFQQRAVAEAVKKGRPPPAPVKLELISAENFPEAFMAAKLVTKPGDIVLLSPACASFDMFTDYKERGEIFRRFVEET